ncbi:hypothetical protein AwDysgo_21460 [Bacteroidales bacterium]|nr:hypothetical protein AwDysgo_21460 [Bacteroidales bacterium]
MSCTRNLNTDKYQNKRDNITEVGDRISEIEIDDVLIGPVARLYLIDDYLIISDPKSLDKLIHIFNKNTFSYVTSTAYRGQGPGEITRMGHIEANESQRIFYVSDHGKQIIVPYNLDSVLQNPSYMPQLKIKMNKSQFPDKYQYINDTLSIGLIIQAIGNADYKPTVARWNMNTGEITPMKYEHPDVKKKRISFAASMENSIYVECYTYQDLMTICSLDGNLKYNIYGKNWNNRGANQVHYYGKVIFCNNKIFAAYSGESRSREEYYPTQLLVFDINGDYLQTLETGYKISDYCYDKENNRIILNLDDQIQFAYLQLDGL